ncbi:hypothetical protein HCDG_01651 [Histoplasma capsulatum H143]|uniref:Uncharacterized protein n=1 Tax=Ajellomyces capsulatus (strain H143) TaxID=544712 RepID=C6H890_AJECH|nr:hypothetical protein HCDG_01651 [Histoplasma capsulatum H143]
MVFSPCPRGQRSKGSANNAEDVMLPIDLVHQDLPARPSSAAVGNLSEERLAFEEIFRPSTRRTGNPETEITPGSHQFPKTAANRTIQIRPKASRISLIQLSHKIRRRLSRESQLSKKSSKIFKGRGVTLQGGDQNVNPAVGVDITTNNDAEYDSDARCILTPQITERITDGIIGFISKPDIQSPERPLDINHDIFPTGLDGTSSAIWDEASNPEKEVPTGNLESLPENNRGLFNFDTSEDGFKPHVEAEFQRSTPTSTAGSYFPEDSAKPTGAKYLDSVPRFESSLSRFSWESDVARTNRLSPPSDFQLELSPPKTGHVAAASGAKAAVSGGYFDLLNGQQLSSERTPNATSQGSFACPRNNKYRTESRFIENFVDIHSSSASDSAIQNSNGIQKYKNMRSISDGWLSDGKRRGYGYRFVMEDDGKPPNSETNDIMQLIYQESTPETDLRDLVEFTGRERSLKYFSQASGESIVTNQAQGPVESLCNGDRNVVSCGGLATSERNLFDCDISKELFSSWARFPSRSKIARNGSAGRSDNVAARDFASIDTPKDNQDTNSPPLPRISNDKSDSLPSIKKGTGLFNWARLHRSDSVDRRRYRAGHRRETSRSDDLKDPDLEIIPGGPTGQLILEQIGDIRSEIKRHNQQLKARGSSERVSEQQTPWSRMLDPAPLGSRLPCRLGFSTFGGSGMDAPSDPCSADVWSRLYEDCIGLFSGDDDVTFDHGTEEGLEEVLIDSEGHRRVSRSMDLRDSTVDFKEEQLLNEVGSKDGLLKLVEQTWGTE